MSKDVLCISQGGSTIWNKKTGEFNYTSFSNFVDLISKYHKRGYKFFIVTGGGYHCRIYQEACRKIGVTDLDELDEVGIDITWQNARVLNSALISRGISLPPIERRKINESIKTMREYGIGISGGIKPRQTTDRVVFDALLTLQKLYPHVNELINLTDKDGIYNPKIYPKRKVLIREVKASELCELVKNREAHEPGIEFPIEPSIVKRITEDRLDIKIHIINGIQNSSRKIENFENVLDGKEYFGTTILPY